MFCRGGEINFLHEAANYHGCEVIIDELQVRIAEDSFNVMEELTQYFSSIVEIFGFVKISRSSSITSLEFLKTVRVIHGKKLENSVRAIQIQGSSLS